MDKSTGGTGIKTSFTTRRINITTFLIVEQDAYSERPYIYAKQHPSAPVLVLCDTGCDAPEDPSVGLSSLREYLETHPIPELDGEPLNPLVKDADSGAVRPEREYVVVCTHCHYDHIGGIEAFTKPRRSGAAPGSVVEIPAKTTIIASALGKDFIEHDLATHSLCRFQHPPIPVPQYKVTHYVTNGARLALSPPSTPHTTTLEAPNPTTTRSPPAPKPLGITFLTTPGHTPDSLAWYDASCMSLYTGDSFYRRRDTFHPHRGAAPIIFPKEGDMPAFLSSLRALLSFVRAANNDSAAAASLHPEAEWELLPSRVRLNAGHTTCNADAEEVLQEVMDLFGRLVKGQVRKVLTYKNRGEDVSLWQDGKGDEALYAVLCPDRLIEEARGMGALVVAGR